MAGGAFGVGEELVGGLVGTADGQLVSPGRWRRIARNAGVGERQEMPAERAPEAVARAPQGGEGLPGRDVATDLETLDVTAQGGEIVLELLDRLADRAFAPAQLLVLQPECLQLGVERHRRPRHGRRRQPQAAGFGLEPGCCCRRLVLELLRPRFRIALVGNRIEVVSEIIARRRLLQLAQRCLELRDFERLRLPVRQIGLLPGLERRALGDQCADPGGPRRIGDPLQHIHGFRVAANLSADEVELAARRGDGRCRPRRLQGCFTAGGAGVVNRLDGCGIGEDGVVDADRRQRTLVLLQA
ncbi:MAG: hypothetical protein AW08_03359 [Candidatus Accumulibacter adjunctus]|uniref:Uncharacterized protein n=1 Tax=Candidatus Accumulibacter adjunctus TaxID=1454001 RepID=A0A011MRH6_9PROT|nr:MAG: hypothetical protein AW08_03359 [Candidatus Accumulibacter adjunctus]